MAYVLIGGTAVGTVLTLAFLPALYAIWFRVRQPLVATVIKPALPVADRAGKGRGMREATAGLSIKKSSLASVERFSIIGAD